MKKNNIFFVIPSVICSFFLINATAVAEFSLIDVINKATKKKIPATIVSIKKSSKPKFYDCYTMKIVSKKRKNVALPIFCNSDKK